MVVAVSIPGLASKKSFRSHCKHLAQSEMHRSVDNEQSAKSTQQKKEK